jgi:hypothetical protein
MDDLNRDSRSNARDAEVLYRLFDDVHRWAVGWGDTTRQGHGPFVPWT